MIIYFARLMSSFTKCIVSFYRLTNNYGGDKIETETAMSSEVIKKHDNVFVLNANIILRFVLKVLRRG